MHIITVPGSFYCKRQSHPLQRSQTQQPHCGAQNIPRTHVQPQPRLRLRFILLSLHDNHIPRARYRVTQPERKCNHSARLVCLQCRLLGAQKTQRLFRNSTVTATRLFSASRVAYSSDCSSSNVNELPVSSRPPTAPRPNIDIKHIRQNPALYELNSL